MRRLALCFALPLLVVGRPIDAHASEDLVMRHATTSVGLKGRSSGGSITLMKTPGLHYPYVRLTTKEGEESSAILSRLASVHKKSSVCAKWYGKNPVARIDRDALALKGIRNCGAWIFGGTATGLGIPPPPSSLSASCNTAEGRVSLRWDSTPREYDKIGIILGGMPLAEVQGDSTQFSFDKNSSGQELGSELDDITVFVVGSRNGVPSNGAGVRLRKQVMQESLMNVPFTNGVAPNFRRWAYKTPPDTIRFEEGRHAGVGPETDFHKLRGKPFYQSLTAVGDFCGGIVRRFRDLHPGHSYRVSARLNTFGMATGSWTFSLHASYDSPSGSPASPAQMAGVARLPDGATGGSAGRIAEYGRPATTNGEWIERCTEKRSPGNAIGNITLPANVTSITIWVRIAGKEANVKGVGVDSVTITDLGKAENP